MSRRSRAALLAACLAVPGFAAAQTRPPVGVLSGAAAPAAPSYGYQPYNPSNSTGFNHPNQMGFGSYHNPTKLTGHRSGSLSYRRFNGY